MKKITVSRSLIIMILVLGGFSLVNAQQMPETGGKINLELTSFRGEGIKNHDRAITTIGTFSLVNAQQMPDTTGKIKLELISFLGKGIKEHERGITTEGKTVKLSGGGGTGLGVTLGYGLSKNLEVDLSAGYQKSIFLPEVSNAKGEFKRDFILGTLKLNLPHFYINKTKLKIGTGIGYYTSGKWDEDFSQLPGGSHTVIKYYQTIGIHLMGELEYFISNTQVVTAEIKYYNVAYDAKSVTYNNISLPTYYLKDEFKKLNGQGVDIVLGLALYF